MYVCIYIYYIYYPRKSEIFKVEYISIFIFSQTFKGAVEDLEKPKYTLF